MNRIVGHEIEIRYKGGSRLREILKTAFRSLFANKTRSSLTMLGIIIGVGAVITMIAIGSGGNFAQSAAIALLENTELDARTIVEKSLKIAGDICVFTNGNHTIEVLDYSAK